MDDVVSEQRRLVDSETVTPSCEPVFVGDDQTPRPIEERVAQIETVLAGVAAVLASPPAPHPCETPAERVEVLEAVVTGAGAVLRSLFDEVA